MPKAAAHACCDCPACSRISAPTSLSARPCAALPAHSPCPLPPQMPRMRGTLILGRSRKFLATWMDSLSRKAGAM